MRRRPPDNINTTDNATDTGSPCNGLCEMDAGAGVCAGCGRTLEEIAGWAAYPAEVREAIRKELPERPGKRRPWGKRARNGRHERSEW